MQPSIRGAARGRSVVTRFATLAALLTLIALALPGVAQAAPPPTITGFSPMSGPAGTTLVTITGTNFTGATSVTFTPNRTVVPPGFTVNVPGTQITVTVPANAHTGPIDVTTPDGTATSADSFVVTATSAPSITSFTPSGGAVGTVVTINGTNFDGVSAVTFGTPAVGAQSFTFVSSLEITATVAVGTTTGPVKVTTPNGTATSASNFTVLAGAPTITGFSPTSGPIGTSVTITGTNFLGATDVKFNTTSQPTFTVNGPGTQITATVPSGATTGTIKVTTPSGTATSSGTFTVTAAGAPTITGFAPPSGPIGTLVVITGTNFLGATTVVFGNKAAASFTVDSATQISATVANGTQSGPIHVTTPAGTATSATNFTIAPAGSPTISSFTPTSGAVGTVVTINGTNFTGATDLKFNVTAASTFTVVNSTQITATVATGTTTGYISVTTPLGTGSSATKFTVPGTPEITSFSPASGPVGTTVTINGSNLTGATAVKFNTTAAASFTVDNPNTITAVVASGTTTGKISVTTPNGTNYSATDFVVATPEITSFDPLKGTWGTSVVITGSVLTGATAVKFGGTNAASFTVDSDTQITAVVANGTGTGAISVTLPSGTLTSADPFTVVHRRTISLSLSRHLVARGQVVCDDGSVGCTQAVPVKVQRRVDGVWKTVGTGFTTSSGTYRISVTDKDGRYRAIAKKSLLSNGDICRKARSAVVLN